MDETGRLTILSRFLGRKTLAVAICVLSCATSLSVAFATERKSPEAKISGHLPASQPNVNVCVGGGFPSKCNEAAKYLNEHGIEAGCQGSLSYSLDVSLADSMRAIDLLKARYQNSREFTILEHPVWEETNERPEERTLHLLLNAHIKKGMSKKHVVRILKRCRLRVWNGASYYFSHEDRLNAEWRHYNSSDEWRPTAVFRFDSSSRFEYYTTACYYYPRQVAAKH